MVTVREIISDKSYVRIHLDDGRDYWIQKNDFPLTEFYEGDTYDKTQFLKKISICQYPRALNYAVSLLARRPYSKKEILFRLVRRRYTEEVADLVVYKLQKEGLLDDESFCEQWIRFRLDRRYGPDVIKRELKMKGISEEVILNVFRKFDSETELDNAVILAKKVLKHVCSVDDKRKIRHKAVTSLVRKGYSWETAQNAVSIAEKSCPD